MLVYRTKFITDSQAQVRRFLSEKLVDSEDVRDVAMHDMINVTGSEDARDVAEVRRAVAIHDMINFVYSDSEDARDVVETSGSRTVTARGTVTARVKSSLE